MFCKCLGVPWGHPLPPPPPIGADKCIRGLNLLQILEDILTETDLKMPFNSGKRIVYF